MRLKSAQNLGVAGNDLFPACLPSDLPGNSCLPELEISRPCADTARLTQAGFVFVGYSPCATIARHEGA
jgi:hypothetical protein